MGEGDQNVNHSGMKICGDEILLIPPWLSRFGVTRLSNISRPADCKIGEYLELFDHEGAYILQIGKEGATEIVDRIRECAQIIIALRADSERETTDGLDV